MCQNFVTRNMSDSGMEMDCAPQHTSRTILVFIRFKTSLSFHRHRIARIVSQMRATTPHLTDTRQFIFSTEAWCCQTNTHGEQDFRMCARVCVCVCLYLYISPTCFQFFLLVFTDYAVRTGKTHRAFERLTLGDLFTTKNVL